MIFELQKQVFNQMTFFINIPINLSWMRAEHRLGITVIPPQVLIQSASLSLSYPLSAKTSLPNKSKGLNSSRTNITLVSTGMQKA